MVSLVLCAAGLGAATLMALRVPHERPGECAALSLAAGMGLLAVLLGVMGLVGVLGWARWLLPVGALITGGWWLQHRRRSGGFRWPRPAPALVVAGLLLIPVFLGSLPPVTDDDSLAYPIPIAEQLAQDGEWRFWPHLARSVYPLSQQFLTAALLTPDSAPVDRPNGLLSAVQFVLTGALVALLAMRVLERRGAGVTAAVIALGCPAATFLVGAAKEDLLVMTMTAAGALALVFPPGAGAVALVGLFAGLAAGAKYNGLPVAVAMVACVPFLCGRHRRAQSLALAAVVALAAGGLWYGVNLARFGNPVVPAFPSIGTFPTSPEVVREWLGGFGYSRSWSDFVLAPVRMALEVITWNAGSFGGRNNWINPIAWIGVPWALWTWRRRPAFLPLTAIAFALYVTWFNGTQVARLLLPSLVLLAVPAADAVLTAWDRFRLARVPITLVLVVSMSLVVVVGAVRFTRYVADPAGFLMQETQHYDAIEWMNTNLDPARHRVGSHLRAPAYLAIPWMNLSPDYQVEIMPAELDDEAQFPGALRRQGITHLLGRPDKDEDYPDWLVPVYVNESSLEGGSRFFRASPTRPVAVFEVRW
jgi:hypothetical protein